MMPSQFQPPAENIEAIYMRAPTEQRVVASQIQPPADNIETYTPPPIQYGRQISRVVAPQIQHGRRVVKVARRAAPAIQRLSVDMDIDEEEKGYPPEYGTPRFPPPTPAVSHQSLFPVEDMDLVEEVRVSRGAAQPQRVDRPVFVSSRRHVSWGDTPIISTPTPTPKPTPTKRKGKSGRKCDTKSKPRKSKSGMKCQPPTKPKSKSGMKCQPPAKPKSKSGRKC